MTTDEQYMLRALEQAQMAADRDEVPVGVVVVCQDRIIARPTYRLRENRERLPIRQRLGQARR